MSAWVGTSTRSASPASTRRSRRGTPSTRRAAALRVGDRAWFRHAKAGELCERFDAIHAIAGGELVATYPTYRGEGKTFL
jgi:D-serine deaminase-like pyridoxal phosphate-dependent protein